MLSLTIVNLLINTFSIGFDMGFGSEDVAISNVNIGYFPIPLVLLQFNFSYTLIPYNNISEENLNLGFSAEGRVIPAVAVGVSLTYNLSQNRLDPESYIAFILSQKISELFIKLGVNHSLTYFFSIGFRLYL